MKKFLCISFALLLLLAAFAACTEQTPDATEAPDNGQTESDVVEATKPVETDDYGQQGAD